MELTLYEITSKWIEFMDQVDNMEVTEEEYQKFMKELSEELQNKSNNIIGFIRNVEARINAIKDEETRLTEMRKIAERKLDRFKMYVKDNMETMEIKKIPTDIGNISVIKNPMSVEIINEKEIPGEFIDVIVTKKPNKTKIKEHFKETGEILPGTKIIENKTSLRIN